MNSEKVIADYLRQHPAVAAITDRIVSKTPENTDEPWVRYTQINRVAVGDHRSDHLIELFIQLDCYAGKDRVSQHDGQPGATRLAQAVREAMLGIRGTYNGVVVTGAAVRGDSRIPDTELDHRQRFVQQYVVWMHDGAH